MPHSKRAPSEGIAWSLFEAPTIFPHLLEIPPPKLYNLFTCEKFQFFRKKSLTRFSVLHTFTCTVCCLHYTCQLLWPLTWSTFRADPSLQKFNDYSKNNCWPAHSLYSSGGQNLQWVSVHKFHDYSMTVEVNRLWDRITIIMKSLEITKIN